MIRRYVPVVVALFALPAATAGLNAQGAETFEACFVPDVGAIYLIKRTGLPEACLAATHQAISWTQGSDLADGAVTEPKLAFDPATQAELDALLAALGASGTVNAGGNPVHWTQLKGVPAAFADGTDDTGDDPGVTDHAALTGLGADDHPQYLLSDGARSTTNGFAVTGNKNTGSIPTSGAGVRMMWYPGKAAFRAGEARSTQWDDANVGENSIGLGLDVTASALGSVSLGFNTSATGILSTALGSQTSATQQYATAMGSGALASGYGSTAIGVGPAATGGYSTALGSSTVASGQYGAAMGLGATASGFASTAMGSYSTASGNLSTALGSSTAQPFLSLAIGRFNVVEGSLTSWVATDPLFVAGNGGSSGTPSNALTLLKNGNLTIAGTLTESSDIRLKHDIAPLSGVLARVLRLEPLRYRFRPGTGHPDEPKLGLSAQAVQPLFPELVRQGGDGYLSVAYADLSTVLVAAIQEQQAEIESLRARNATLENEVDRRIAALEVILRGQVLTRSP